MRRDFRFLARNEAGDFLRSGFKPQFSVKPERAGLDRFFVALSELIRVYGETTYAKFLPQQLQYSCENPRRFTIAKRVIKIKSYIHAAGPRHCLDVACWNAVLEVHPRVVGADRKPLLGRNPKKV